VGFSELYLIGLVSLSVIGFERLPKMARLAGFWLGKTRSMPAFAQAEEFRQIFKEQSGLQDDCKGSQGTVPRMGKAEN
jgi:sec-independent protein translocase protein TatB